MQVNQDPNFSHYKIQSYTQTPPSIRVNDTVYTMSLLFDKTQLTLWRPVRFEDIQVEDFKGVLEHSPSIFLLGTGPNLHIPSMDLLRPLFERGIGVEFMSTAAAVRTYVILSSEQRDVAMALIL